MIDYAKDSFIAIDIKGRLFMAVEADGVLYDREVHMLGQRKPMVGAKRR